MKTVQIVAVLAFCSIIRCQNGEKRSITPDQIIQFAKSDKALYFFLKYAQQINTISYFSEKDKNLAIMKSWHIHDELQSYLRKTSKLEDKMIKTLMKMLDKSMKDLSQKKYIKARPFRLGKK